MVRKSKSLYSKQERESMQQPSHILVTINQLDREGNPSAVTREDIRANSYRLTQMLSKVPEFIQVYTSKLPKSFRHCSFYYFVKYKGEEKGLRKIAKTLKAQMAKEGVWAHYPGGSSYPIDAKDFIPNLIKDYKDYLQYEEESKQECEFFKMQEEDTKRFREALRRGEINLDTRFVV